MKRILIIGPMGSGKTRKIKEMMSREKNVKYMNPHLPIYYVLKKTNPKWLVLDGMDLKYLEHHMMHANRFPRINMLFTYQGTLKELPSWVRLWGWDKIIDMSNGMTYEKDIIGEGKTESNTTF
ncbi:hypothetical protein [Sphingobacterium anhuiense]|uniref:hypothetical protein n=1 Tax=Sphingobacterium anhuiense TaxID=493780 RepID=UPI003C2AD4A8